MSIKFINTLKKRRFWAAVLFAQFLLFYVGSKSKIFVDFFLRFFENKKTFHQTLFSSFNFSVGDVFYVFLMCIIITAVYLFIKNKKRRSITVLILISLNILYLSYQLVWGMLYFQKPIRDNFPKHEVSVDEVKNLSEQLLEECLQLRKSINKTHPETFTIKNFTQIKHDIVLNQNAIPVQYSNKKTTDIVNIKNTLYGKIMNKTGILGYYNPFSGEAQFNENLPHTYIPFTIAHESAHQLGFAREQEANFIGYLICENSNNNQIKYSAKWFALKSLLNSISENHPKFIEQIKNKFSKEMMLDYNHEKKFWKENEGVLTQFFSITNDLFLKSNQQEGSITYSYFNELLILHKKNNH